MTSKKLIFAIKYFEFDEGKNNEVVRFIFWLYSWGPNEITVLPFNFLGKVEVVDGVHIELAILFLINFVCGRFEGKIFLQIIEIFWNLLLKTSATMALKYLKYFS